MHTNTYTHKGSELEQVVAPLGHARSAYNETGTRGPPQTTPINRLPLRVYVTSYIQSSNLQTNGSNHWILLSYITDSLHWVQCTNSPSGLQFVHYMLVMKVFTHLPPPNLSQSHSVISGACPMLLSPSCLHLHSSAAPPLRHQRTGLLLVLYAHLHITINGKTGGATALSLVTVSDMLLVRVSY